MPPKDNKPVIFLAFANQPADQGHEGQLDHLKNEAIDLREKLTRAKRKGLCDLEVLQDATSAEIFNIFQDEEYSDRIAVFHFAGHANGYRLLLKGGQSAHAEGLAGFLGQQKGLQLVFLNGCSTKEQAKGLIKANVKAVIATSVAVDDAVASKFAGAFYNGLSAGRSVQRAFDEALTRITTDQPDTEKLYRDLDEDENEEISTGEVPWDLYINPGFEKSAPRWNLSDAADMPLAGLPQLPEQDLPSRPYPELNSYTEDEAAIFFGRGYQIRKLYRLVVDSGTDPIILYCGPSFVGKTSLLKAGLIPRLRIRSKDPHDVRDFRLSEGLIKSFNKKLGLNDDTPLLAAWKAAERDAGRPVTMIVDQVEEAFARSSETSKHELEAFLDSLVPVYSERSSRPQGKLILCLRNERLADLKEHLEDRGLPHIECYLKPLDKRGIERAIGGPVGKVECPQKEQLLNYNLDIEVGLAESMAIELLKDPKSSLAETLQIRLARMWESAGSPPDRKFNTDLYNKLESESWDLDKFLDDKFDQLRKTHAVEVENGLVLDILQFHTTPRGTAESRNRKTLEKEYSHVEDGLDELVSRCEDLKLLAREGGDDSGNDGDTKSDQTRLAYNSLAPLILERFHKSTLPGQQARRIIENLAGEWKEGRKDAKLDKFGLKAAKAGKDGMRARKPYEKDLIKASGTAQRNSMIAKWVVVPILAVLVLGYVAKTVKHEADKRKLTAAGVVSLANSAVKSNPLLATQLMASLRSFDEPPYGVQIAHEVAKKAVPKLILKFDQPSEGDQKIDFLPDVSCSADGNKILTTSSDNIARIWTFDAPDDPEQILHGITHAIFNKNVDEPQLATFSSDSVIRIWNKNGHWVSTTLGEHYNKISSMDFIGSSESCQFLVTKSDYGAVTIWNVPESDAEASHEPNECNPPLGADDLSDGNKKSVQLLYKNASYSSDGRHLVYISEDTRAHILSSDYEGETVIGEKLVKKAIMGPDGNRILLNHSTSKTTLWDVKDKSNPTIINVQIPNALRGLKDAKFLTADGQYIVTQTRTTVATWKLQESKNGSTLVNILTFRGKPELGLISKIDICPGDKRTPRSQYIVASYRDEVQVFNARGAAEPLVLARTDKPALNAKFNLHGNLVATIFKDRVAHILKVDASDAPAEWEIESSGPLEIASSVDFSSNGDRVLTVAASGDCLDHPLTEWRVDGAYFKKPSRAKTPPHEGCLKKASYNPAKNDDGSGNQFIVISGGSANTAEIYNGARQPPWRDLDLYNYDIQYAEFNRDGTWIVTGNRIDGVLVDEIATFENEHEKLKPLKHKGMVQMAVFSPNSELIATASNDGIVRLFDLGGSEEPKKPKRFAGIGKATGVDFSPNGDLLVSSSNTGEARVWNSDGDGETLVIYSVPRSMNSAEFGPSDGPAAYRILTTSDDGAVRLWRYRWKDLVAAIDESTQLCLTVEDRINYLREERKEAECGIKECKRRKKNNLAGKGDRVPPMDTNIFSSIRNLFGPSRVECDSKTDTAKGK